MLLRASLLAIVITLVGPFTLAAQVPDTDAFYQPPAHVDKHRPGDLLRTEEMAAPHSGVRLWRILYVSTNLDDTPIAVSALLAAPTTPPPSHGFPLVTVGHGSVGVATQCAPSLDPARSSPGSPGSFDLFMAPLVSAGYAAVMSDYQGLGVANDSSFLVGVLEGRNLLDAARAALAFPNLTLQPDVMIWGQSQGGHAALFAAQLAPVYAPDLTILGVIAEAPVIDLEEMFDTLITVNERGGVISLALMTADAWASTYPTIDIDLILTVRGQLLLENVIRQFCLTPAFLFSQFSKPSDLIVAGTIDRLNDVVAANTPQSGSYAMPVLIVQGDKDEVIPEETTRRIADEMCAAGTDLTYRSYPGAGHTEVIAASIDDVLSWMDTIRQGDRPSSTCSA